MMSGLRTKQKSRVDDIVEFGKTKLHTCTMLSLCNPPPYLRSRSTRATLIRRCRSYWTGLNVWRKNPINDNRSWGQTGPSPSLSPSPPFDLPSTPSSLAEWGALVLSTPDPVLKSHLSHMAFTSFISDSLPIGIASAPLRPARPSKPPLVEVWEVPTQKESGLPLNAYMLHSLAHIELNAIDLAWDTVVRFSDLRSVLGDGFFADFARVADDESRHFGWCSQRLEELGFQYGDVASHDFLWKECARTSSDVAPRLAIVPLVQEARGIDAGPRLVKKLSGFGDNRTAKIVSKIADEEVAHVGVGVYWFIQVCEKMNWTPRTAFRTILQEFGVEPKGPFNHAGRSLAGIPRDWYDPPHSSPPPPPQSFLSEVIF